MVNWLRRTVDDSAPLIGEAQLKYFLDIYTFFRLESINQPAEGTTKPFGEMKAKRVFIERASAEKVDTSEGCIPLFLPHVL